MDQNMLMQLMGQLPQMAAQGIPQMPGQMPPMQGQQQTQARPGMAFAQQGPPAQTEPQQPPAHGGGMFAAGGAGRAIAGMIGDFLLQRAGMRPIYQPTMLEQRRHQREIDDYNRKRADDNADWRTQYDYELAHPKEGTGSEYERLLTAAGITPGTPQYQQHVTAKVNQLENPMVMTPYGPMPYSAVNPPAPTAPVGKLTPIDGGPTPGASGGFPY